MPQEIWDIFLQACVSMENNDNSMSGNATKDARQGIDWLMDNLPD